MLKDKGHSNNLSTEDNLGRRRRGKKEREREREGEGGKGGGGGGGGGEGGGEEEEHTGCNLFNFTSRSLICNE